MGKIIVNTLIFVFVGAILVVIHFIYPGFYKNSFKKAKSCCMSLGKEIKEEAEKIKNERASHEVSGEESSKVSQ